MSSRLARSTATVAVAFVLGLAATTGAVRASPQPGQPAPEFVGRDSRGVEHKLSALKGKTVVLEWTNHECPYTVKHYATGNMQALQTEAATKGVVWLTIVSSAPGGQGHVDGRRADELTEQRKAQPAAVLLDPAGRIGRAYEARTTPHMFVVDQQGRIAYMGAIDDNASASAAGVAKARNYVREALAAVASGQPVKMASTRPYGCSVKY